MAKKNEGKISKVIFNTKIITWPGTIVCVKSLFNSTNLLGVMLNFRAMELRVSWLLAWSSQMNKHKYIR